MLLLEQFPFDPASGAARSMRTISEIAARNGWRVRAVSTTETEAAAPLDALETLRRNGCAGVAEHSVAGARALRCTHRAVEHTVLISGGASFRGRLGGHNAALDRIVDAAFEDERPDAVFTYGGSAEHVARLRAARARGSAIVFGLRNAGYLHREAFEHVDHVLSAGRWLSDTYKREIGLDSVPIPTPIDPADVVAPRHEPVFVTAVNPTLEKGVYAMVRMFEELGVRRPDIPLLTVASRGDTGAILRAANDAGVDLARHQSLMHAPGVAMPASIYAQSRIVLVPSLWCEPSGRIGAEALVNGVPPIVSDRGGLPDTVRPEGGPEEGGGFVLPLPERLTHRTHIVPTREEVRDWTDLIERLCDDEPFYEQSSARAREAGCMYAPEVIEPQYAAFFDGVAACPM
ncbi:MAG: glycosyltransferase [Phycisphaerales bacterium]|nr:MAG: glycosyltransferase [Phycisphaerales bacterium]